VTGRDLDTVRDGIGAWLRDRYPDRHPVVTGAETPAATGYSNDVVFVSVAFDDGSAARRELVLRLPPDGPTLFPRYDLAMQVAVQEAVRAAGVPVPGSLVVETEARWLGLPFLVMDRVVGRVPGELAALDPWITGLAPDRQRTLHEGFLDALARVHGTPWPETDLVRRLPGAGGTLADDIEAEIELAAWAFEGSPPAPLTEALAWCRDRRPDPEPPRTVLWGDARLGNVVFGDDLAPRALLDWEMAAIGPAESDLAWYTALDEIGTHFVGQTVPGFLGRDEIVAHHEQALGRTLVAFRWFELLAMLRSSTLNLRRALLAARRRDRAPRPPTDDAVLRYTLDAIAAADTP
jgi:aminoglycoside phosphotransferase (APT) family kinase protein